ncbi:hypothetical protein D3C71_1215300 [compost metagenome]
MLLHQCRMPVRCARKEVGRTAQHVGRQQALLVAVANFYAQPIGGIVGPEKLLSLLICIGDFSRCARAEIDGSAIVAAPPIASLTVLWPVPHVVHQTGLVLSLETLNTALDAIEKIQCQIASGDQAPVLIDVVRHLIQPARTRESAGHAFKVAMDGFGLLLDA